MREFIKKIPFALFLYRAGNRLLRRRRLKRLLNHSGKKKIIIASGGTIQEGWIRTRIDTLNLLREQDWKKYFQVDSIDAILAEHVWEHLTQDEGRIAAENCYRYLKPGGYLRMAVPDGFHPDPEYINTVKVNGSGAGSEDHKVLYTYRSLAELLHSAGFSVHCLEYFDERGEFHYVDWDPDQGMIKRSRRFDERNRDGVLRYTSVIIDAIKDAVD